MNIFYLDKDVKQCAEMHVDKHVVKMILEYAQLLSTAHRFLDGKEVIGKSKTGRKATRWELGDSREDKLYKASHINHPSAVWVRKSCKNYKWLYELFCATCDEYTYRYGKKHLTDTKLRNILALEPENIACGEFTEPTPAMPDEYKVDGDSISSYHNYYNGAKTTMFSWKNRPTPKFIK